jgi:hypothetical protein
VLYGEKHVPPPGVGEAAGGQDEGGLAEWAQIVVWIKLLNELTRVYVPGSLGSAHPLPNEVIPYTVLEPTPSSGPPKW